MVMTVLAGTSVACQEQPLDAAAPKLPIPNTLPALNPTPVAWSVARRARMLHEDGEKALLTGQFKDALSHLTGAVQLDPSRIEARLALARLYAKAGRSSVSLTLLESMVAKDCGGCVEALQFAKADPLFVPIWQHRRGQALAEKLPTAALPWERWVEQTSHSFADGIGRELPKVVHAQIGFELVRSCPDCSNPDRRKPERRRLFGARIAVKLASRFNTTQKRFGGVNLIVGAAHTRKGRCVIWSVPSPVPVGQAALRELCFRPLTPTRAALTKIDVVYGQSVVDAAKKSP
ncbi:MAG: tetratricopeptide repeat protein [Myxococcales bacterium]|nr:tetratricopeptide repeat protein [Myxococcales bacterium]